jgi:hypothetical protein
MDEYESDYWGELLPYETWKEYDERHTYNYTNDIIETIIIIQDYYLEQEDMN